MPAGTPAPAPPSSSGGSQQQSPSIFGTGQYYAPAYSGFDASQISGTPSQGDGNYGLNDVWAKLQNLANSQPQNYAVQAPMANAAQGQAAQSQAAQGMASLGMAASYQAALAQAAQARAAQAQGATAGAATTGPATMAAAPTISTAGDASQLGVQQGLENTLQRQANGQGVSAADLQLRAGEQQQVANQLAVLGSQRGGAMNAGLAQTAAANQAAQAQAQLNAQMGIQRAQETQAAQQALGNVASQARGQSQAYNANQAQLASTANLANAGASNQMAEFNVGNEQAANLANAQLAQGNSQFNAANAQAASLANAQLAQQTNLANQGAANTAAATNAGNAQNMTLANLAALNAQTQQNVGNAQQTGLANTNNAQAMALANLGNAQQTNLANLSLAGQYGLANQTAAENAYNNALQAQLAALGAQTGIGEANRSANLAGQQLGVQQQLGIDQIDAQTFQAAAQNNANLAGAVGNAISGAIPTLANAFNSLGSSGGSSGGLPAPSSEQAAPGSAGADTGGPPAGSGGDTVGNESFLINPMRLSDENVKTGVEGGNPMMGSFLDELSKSKQDQKIDPNADMGFRLATYGKQTSTTGPSDGGIGAKAGSALGGAALGAAAGSVVPGIGTAIGGLLGSLFGGALGSAADGGGSTNTRNAMMSPGSGETATQGSISDIDEEGPVATSDDEAKENVISGNRGMQAFLQQAGAQQSANAARGSTNNSFMQTGQTPSNSVDRPLPAAPPWAQGYGQSQGGGTFLGSGPAANAGGFSGGGGPNMGRLANMGGEMGASFLDGAVSPGGVASMGGNMAPGGVSTFGWSGGTPMPARTTPTNAMNPVVSAQMVPTPMQATQQLGNIYSAWNPTLSDERAKVESDDDVGGFLDALHAHQYRYKEPDLPGAGHGTFVSPMAQELEKTDLGKSFVFNDPSTGYKKVDYGKMAGTQLAATAYLNERLNEVESFLHAAKGARS